MSGTASEIMSPGRTIEFATAVLRQLPRDITPERALQWINDQSGLQSALRQALIPTNDQTVAISTPVGTTYSICVNYDLALKAMVKAGRFDWVNGDIVVKNFPRSEKRGPEEVTIELIKYDRSMESEAVFADLEARGMRPGTIEEACTLGATHPDVQREFPVIFLGSGWAYPDGRRYVPCLCLDDYVRYLHLGWWGSRWDAVCRFAAVRK